MIPIAISGDPEASPRPEAPPPPPGRRVAIVDVDIPFGRLVLIWFKVWAASLPLSILIALAWVIIRAIVTAGPPRHPMP